MALDEEREKYRLGFGSLVDILTIEDRLTASLAVEVRARLTRQSSWRTCAKPPAHWWNQTLLRLGRTGRCL